MNRIGIICAGYREFEPFLPHIKNSKITSKAMLKFYEGKINGLSVVVVYCGVCKVNAAIATQLLIDAFSVSKIINSGTGSGMNKDIKVFDTVISTQTAYHDVADGILTEFHPWLTSMYFNADPKLLEIAKIIADRDKPVFLGRIITGEHYIEKSMQDALNKKYQPLSVDMETASVAHVCYANEIPFISIRTITETLQDVAGVYEMNCQQACIISTGITLDFLTELEKSLNDNQTL